MGSGEKGTLEEGAEYVESLGIGRERLVYRF